MKNVLKAFNVIMSYFWLIFVASHMVVSIIFTTIPEAKWLGWWSILLDITALLLIDDPRKEKRSTARVNVVRL